MNYFIMNHINKFYEYGTHTFSHKAQKFTLGFYGHKKNPIYDLIYDGSTICTHLSCKRNRNGSRKRIPIKNIEKHVKDKILTGLEIFNE